MSEFVQTVLVCEDFAFHVHQAYKIYSNEIYYIIYVYMYKIETFEM